MHGLDQIVILLAAAVLGAPLAQRLGLGAVLGYLLAGVAVGPWGLGLVHELDTVNVAAEFGVVLFLFLIGLELSPARLWALRGPVFGQGGAQGLAVGAAFAAAAWTLGQVGGAALVIGVGAALSSTAIALQVLKERNLLGSGMGRSAFAILLFQDVAVIPILAVLPLLTPATRAVEGQGLGVAKALAAIALVIVAGRWLTRPLFRAVAAAGLREAFTALALLIVVGIAWLMHAVGLSMGLGAFLAGVLLADSEYRHALESDIEPFKGLLLGLFFLAIGMGADLGTLSAQPLAALGLAAALVAGKAALMYALACAFRLPAPHRAPFALALAQVGEFAFVLFAQAATLGIVGRETHALLVIATALSMMMTPLLMLFHDRVLAPRHARLGRPPEDAIEDQGAEVIVAGFGRVGQIVARLLHANGIAATLIDHDPNHIEAVRRFGFRVFYGDATRLELLESAGLARAKLLVIALDDRAGALALVERVREAHPQVAVLARAWDVLHAFELMDRGVSALRRESFDGALALGVEALRRLGFGAHEAHRRGQHFRAHDEALLARLYTLRAEPTEIRARIAREAREELVRIMEADETAIAEDREHDWD